MSIIVNEASVGKARLYWDNQGHWLLEAGEAGLVLSSEDGIAYEELCRENLETVRFLTDGERDVLIDDIEEEQRAIDECLAGPMGPDTGPVHLGGAASDLARSWGWPLCDAWGEELS